MDVMESVDVSTHPGDRHSAAAKEEDRVRDIQMIEFVK